MTLSISKLKEGPSKAITHACEYPVATENRDKVRACLIGKDLCESLVSYIENYIDSKVVDTLDFSKGKNLDELTRELGGMNIRISPNAKTL